MFLSTARVAAALLCVWQFGMTAAIAQTASQAADDVGGAPVKVIVQDATTEPQAPAASDLRDGTIKTVQGEVSVVREKSQTTALAGGPVHAPDRIQTGADSAAAITMMDGTILSIGPNSVVELSSFQFDPTTQDGHLLVNLVSGTLRMTTGVLAKTKPEQVKVTTPTTVIGVRGTDFIVEERS